MSDKETFGDMRDYMAPSLFQPHRARDAIKDAHSRKISPMVGYFAGLASIPITRLLAPLGFDWVWFDWEHSSCNVETMTTMVHEMAFMSGGRTIPFVRVPGHDHAAINYAMDAGASLIIPQVDTVEQARYIMSGTKFGTKERGSRSAPPFRLIAGITDTPLNSQKDMWRNWNDQAAVVIQIESLQGIDNLDAILTEVPEIDAVWLGMLDTRISMNMPSGFGVQCEEPEWLAAVEKFHATLKKHNKPYASFAFATGEELRKVTESMSMCLITSDVPKLMEMGGQLAEAKSSLAQK
ncbi:Phosphoenolpyruvate/pyruvate domain-containing protein [Trichoderma chlorosporum]